MKKSTRSLEKYIYPLKFLIAILTSMFVFFGLQVLLGNMSSLTMEFSAFGFKCVTTESDRFLNAMFFITPACILLFIFGLLESIERPASYSVD